MTLEEHLMLLQHSAYTIFSVTLLSINYKKPHKSRLKYEIKYDMYKISLDFQGSFEAIPALVSGHPYESESQNIEQTDST